MMNTVFAVSSFICGFCLMAIGFINFFKHVMGDSWCHDSCFGPYLFWNEDDFFHDGNPRFRNTFSLMPKPFGEHFGIFFLAYITLRAHFHMSHEFLTTFTRNSFWMLFIALFAAFPFAGGLGIILGFLCCVVALIGFICTFQKNEGSPNLAISTDSAWGVRCGGNLRFPGWFVKIVNLTLTILLVLTIINNLVHVLKNEFHHWCHDNDDCVGPYLIWPDDFMESVNADKWGSVFSLDLNRGLELWAPTFMVILFIASGNESWTFTAFFLILLSLFGAFGFAGNGGVILGSMLLFGALLSFVLGLCGARESQVPAHGYSLLGGV